MRGWVEPVMGALASRIGVTVGQAYTLCFGLVVALVLGGIGIPPVLDGAGEVLAAPLVRPVERGDDDVALEEQPPVVPPPIAGGEVAVPFLPAERLPALAPPTGSGSPLAQPSAPTRPGPAGTVRVLATVPAPGSPEGVAVGPDGTIYVATDDVAGRGRGGQPAVFAMRADGTAIGAWVLPKTETAGEREVGLTGLTVDRQGRVWVLDAASARVLRLDPRLSTMETMATIPDVAPCVLPGATDCEPGLVDQAPELRGVVLVPGPAVLVTDRAQGLIWSIGADGAVAVWAAIDDRAPGEGPWGIARDGAGAVVVTVSGVLTSPGQAAVIVIARDADGGAGSRVTKATLAASDRPTALAVGAGGTIYLALSGANRLLAIAPDGTTTPVEGEGMSPPFDQPMGLALRRGSVLIANQAGATSDPARWVVFELVVDDEPVAP